MESENTNAGQQLNDAITSVQNGNAAAFETIVRHFERSVRTWLAANSPPGVDVDDVAQRSFVAAYSRIAEFQPDTRFGAWLFTIARYQLRTEVTRLRRVADYHSRYAPDLLSSEIERQADAATGDETVRLEYLRNCLEQMGEHLRRFVRWRYEEEISLQEMSERCGRSVAAVKKQLWKIRGKLQSCVEARMSNSAAHGGSQ